MNLLEKYPVFERVPEGWKIIRGAINRPPGYRWVCNGKSRFSEEYEKGFVTEEVAIEWRRDNT